MQAQWNLTNIWQNEADITRLAPRWAPTIDTDMGHSAECIHHVNKKCSNIEKLNIKIGTKVISTLMPSQ